MAFFRKKKDGSGRQGGSDQGSDSGPRGESASVPADPADPADPALVEEPETYRAVGLRLIPAGNESVLVLPLAGSSGLLPTYTAECLARCQGFETLEDHASRIGREMGFRAVERDGLLEQLKLCVARNFITPRSSVVRDWPPAESDSGTAIGSVGMVTADRVGHARRAFESYMENARQFGRECDWIVYDDSDTLSIRNEYRDMAKSLGRDFGTKVFYAGMEEKRAFAGELAATGLAPDLMEFALFGLEGLRPTCGANRNAFLLDLAGESALCVDDDTICHMGRPPEILPGLELRSGDPTEFWFHADRDSARGGFEAIEADFLALHEATLGKPIRGCVGEPPGGGSELILDQASDHLIKAFAAGSGRIAVTSLGVAGDSGMGSTRYYLSLAGDSRNRLLEDPEFYRAFMESRALVRSPLRRTIGDGSWFMAYAAGFDNRLLLPPFFPVKRNSDGLFAAVLPVVDQAAFFGYEPSVIEHDPPGDRKETVQSIRNATVGTNLADLVMLMVHSFPAAFPFPAPVAERTRALGRYLRTIGGLEPRGFEDFVFPLIWRAKADAISQLEGLLREYGEEPEEWAADVQGCLSALNESLPSRELILPPDLRQDRTAEETLAITQRLIGLYGRLLESWPDIVDAAKCLKAKGRRVATRA
jgi:hypothetical protein